MKESLRICPHCGNRAEVVSMYDCSEDKYTIFVECQTCGARGGASETPHSPRSNMYNGAEALAINAWNASIYEVPRYQ